MARFGVLFLPGYLSIFRLASNSVISLCNNRCEREPVAPAVSLQHESGEIVSRQRLPSSNRSEHTERELRQLHAYKFHPNRVSLSWSLQTPGERRLCLPYLPLSLSIHIRRLIPVD